MSKYSEDLRKIFEMMEKRNLRQTTLSALASHFNITQEYLERVINKDRRSFDNMLKVMNIVVTDLPPPSN